jgi:hypothetical protein
MPFKNSEREKSSIKATKERDSYAVNKHGHPLVVAARDSGELTGPQAAELVYAGACRGSIPSDVPVDEDITWGERLISTGAPFFAAATIAARKVRADEALKRDGVAFVRASAFSEHASAFVETLRLRAPNSLATPGTSSVDGRIKLPVPSASVLRLILIAFARSLQPSMFPVNLTDGDFEISFIYLTLLASSNSQAWHKDYVSKPNAIVFLLMLDDGEKSTEWKVGKTDEVMVSDAKVGDIASFFPSTVHRGVATGSLRRAIYVSIRVINTRREAIDALHAAIASGDIQTFEGADYADCI